MAVVNFVPWCRVNAVIFVFIFTISQYVIVFFCIFDQINV